MPRNGARGRMTTRGQRAGAASSAAKRRGERRERVDQFAELLAEGLSVASASASLGLSSKRGVKYLADIRKGLGPQAV